MAVLEEIKAANAAYVAQFDKGSLPLPPGRKFTVVTCMDARLDPAKALGLSEGDAHVIRNAGGRAADALRSVVISQQLLGTREVLVIHHTDCGMLTFTSDHLHGLLAERLGADPVPAVDFLPFSDLDQSVRDDVAYLRNSGAVPADIPISGWVYDVTTGAVRPVGN
ncbi:carbonic anhydrase [Dipodascopsis tothii]|uniref:carbonic anhydrase n=1 Tax=Dipodascopsis tothii TaxID=44089 RepID=UPI0034CE33DE